MDNPRRLMPFTLPMAALLCAAVFGAAPAAAQGEPDPTTTTATTTTVPPTTAPPTTAPPTTAPATTSQPPRPTTPPPSVGSSGGPATPIRPAAPPPQPVPAGIQPAYSYAPAVPAPADASTTSIADASTSTTGVEVDPVWMAGQTADRPSTGTSPQAQPDRLDGLASLGYMWPLLAAGAAAILGVVLWQVRRRPSTPRKKAAAGGVKWVREPPGPDGGTRSLFDVATPDRRPAVTGDPATSPNVGRATAPHDQPPPATLPKRKRRPVG
jgi:hypothetical protein